MFLYVARWSEIWYNFYVTILIDIEFTQNLSDALQAYESLQW